MHLLLMMIWLPTLIWGYQEHIVSAPYQVGLYLFDNYSPNFGARNFPLCSAAIIHPLFCLTTADCVHAHITSQNIARPLLPTSLYIKSGNFSEIRQNIKYVKAIYIHPEFDPNTMKNDIALIQVESTLQFENPFNERWVELPDSVVNYRKCIYSINTPNTTELYPFSELKQTTVVANDDICHGNKAGYLYEIAATNLCSFYDFDHPFMCQIPESQLRLNRDRGTPLICDNKLVGLLSVIIPADVTNSTDECARTLRTHAYYTNIAVFERWVHNIIGINAPTHTANGTPISNLIPNSSPYQNTLSKPSSAVSYAKSYCPLVSLMTFVTWLLLIH